MTFSPTNQNVAVNYENVFPPKFKKCTLIWEIGWATFGADEIARVGEEKKLRDVTEMESSEH